MIIYPVMLEAEGRAKLASNGTKVPMIQTFGMVIAARKKSKRRTWCGACVLRCMLHPYNKHITARIIYS